MLERNHCTESQVPKSTYRRLVASRDATPSPLPYRQLEIADLLLPDIILFPFRFNNPTNLFTPPYNCANSFAFFIHEQDHQTLL